MSRRGTVAQPPGRGGVPAPQQETRQREEHGDGQIEAAEQSTRHPAGVPGLERDMGDHDADGRAGSHALDGGQEAAGATRGRRPAGRCAISVDRRASLGSHDVSVPPPGADLTPVNGIREGRHEHRTYPVLLGSSVTEGSLG